MNLQHEAGNEQSAEGTRITSENEVNLRSLKVICVDKL